MTRRGGLDGAVGIPPFLSKTYELVDDVSTNHIVSWMGDGESFVVWTPPEFARDVLPRHFKHNNFSSFVRQLNTYGFRKVDPDRWEFANENFVRGRRDLLKDIHRRKPTNQHHSSHNDDSSALVSTPNPAIELGQYGGLAGEVESLKRDKNLLFGEVLRLRQQQQASDQEQAKLRKRLEGMELGLQQIMGFMAQFASKPELLRNLTHNVQGLPALPSNTVLKGGNRKKRRANGDEDVSHSDPHSSIVQYVAPDMQSFLQSLSNRDASTNCRTAPQGWQPQGQENVLQAFDSLNLEQEPLVSSPPEPSVQIDVEDPSSPGNEERLHIREITAAAGDGELPPASAATAPAVGSPMPGLSTAAAAAARLDADAPTAAAAAAVPADSLPASAALSLTDGTFPRALHASGPTQLQPAAAAPEFATPFTPFTAAATPSAEPPAAEAALAAGEDAVGQAVPAAQGFADAVAGAPAALQPAPSPGAANAAGADAAAAAAGWGPFLGELDVLGELDGLSSLPSIDHLLQGDSSLDFLALQPTQQ